MTKQTKTTETAELKTNWDLTPLFASDKDPKINLAEQQALRASYEFIDKWKDRTDYLEDPKILAEALVEYEAWLKNHGYNNKVCYYFHLQTELDQNNPELKARYNKAKEISIRIQNDIQFFTLNVAKIAPKNRARFLGEPALSPFKHFLEHSFAEAEYLLSNAEEKIINHHVESAYLNWVRLTETELSKEKQNGKTFPELLAEVNNKNQKKRDKAFLAVNKILASKSAVAEAELNSVLGYKKSIDEIRGSARPDFLRHLSDDMPSETVDAMLGAVAERFDLSQRYYAFKARALGLKKIKYYEKNVGFGQTEKKYKYQEAISLVSQVLTSLNQNWKNIFDGFIKNGQIDVYPKQFRSDGAFCTHMSSKEPTYILLNYTDQLRDVTTLAHEFGHGLNNELIKQKQHEFYFDTPVSTAEVASTFVEDFVLEEIGKQADEKTKLSLMMAKLDDDVSTIFRQVAAYRFEQALHKNFREQGYLSQKEIGKLFLENMKAYTGPAMDYPTGTENWWIYWSHFRNFFYVYSYASGLLISKSLQSLVRQNPDHISRVEKFLSAGTSDSPTTIFAELGLDIQTKDFWQKGLTEIENLLNDTEKLYNSLYGTKN